jgi:hypothetical protein
MLVAFVVLHLTVWDADTGKMLLDIEREVTGFTISADKIADCRMTGLDAASQLTARYRAKYPNAFTNVDCEWHRRLGDPA